MSKTNDKIVELTNQVKELKLQLTESLETLEAIQTGEVDALVVRSPSGEQVFTLKDADHPYRVMVETMNEGAATIAQDGTVFYCNNHLASMLKVPLSKIMGAPLGNFIVSSHLPVFRSVLQRASGGNAKAEIEIKDAEGEAVSVLVSARALTGDTKMISLIVTDLSEQRHTGKIIASERFAHILLDQAADAILVCDPKGTVIRASEKAHKVIGTDLEGWNFDQIFTQFYPASSCGIIEKETLTFSAIIGNKIPSGSEVTLLRNTEEQQSFLLNFRPLVEKYEYLGHSVSLTDITSQKKAEQALAKAKDELEIKVKERTQELAEANENLKKYSYRVTQEHEEERKHIANELQDELAQTLGSMKIEADSLTIKVNSLLGNVNSHVDTIRNMIGTTVEDLRTFSNELRPTVLENLGLLEALRIVVAEMNRNGKTALVLKTNGVQRRMPDEIETALFRITQEAINNVRKHSGATKAKINVGFLEAELKLTINDNGKGFDTEFKPVSTSKSVYGLISMKERANLIGGEFKIKSVVGKGTSITVIVPLKSKQA